MFFKEAVMGILSFTNMNFQDAVDQIPDFPDIFDGIKIPGAILKEGAILIWDKFTMVAGKLFKNELPVVETPALNVTLDNSIISSIAEKSPLKEITTQRINETTKMISDNISKSGKVMAISALAISSIGFLVYLYKRSGKLTLKDALEIFEMSDISEFNKKSFSWTYQCKKKQFTTGKGLGNAQAQQFYDEKLRRLEEARAIIEEEIKKKELTEEKEDLVQQ